MSGGTVWYSRGLCAGIQEHPLVWCFPVSLQCWCVAEWPRLGLTNVVGMSLQGNVAGKGQFPNGSSQWGKHLGSCKWGL